MKTNDQYGKFTAPAEVRFVRLLPGPAERVWAYLTDPEKRSRWFAGGAMEPHVGGKVVLKFNHKNLAPGETPPEAMKQAHEGGMTMEGKILRWEPPHVLSYTFDEDSQVTFELAPQGEQVRLVLTHRSRGVDLPFLNGYASGWHTHLSHLIAQLEGAPRPPFWPQFLRLKEEYQKLRETAKA